MVIGEESWFPIKPWLHLVGPDPYLPVRTLLPMPGLTFTAWLDGGMMGDLDGVFQQFYDGFKLPDYFGWSFPALNDCLRDLNWVPANQYVLFVKKAHKVLSEDPEGLRELVGILERVGAGWSHVKRSDGIQRARFQTILASSKERLPSMVEIIEHSTESQGR